MRRRALLLMGPTGSGKSDLAVCLAERFPLEIVSVDSALVYRGMDIGTAKPDLATRARLVHHLIDIREPTTQYSAGEFVMEVRVVMEGIWARGHQPLLVGGTMLYFHALTAGIADLPEANPVVRAAIDAEALAHGWPAMHRQLESVDPLAAARIHANDAQRIQRALEVFRVSGASITSLQQKRVSVLADVEATEWVLAPTQRQELNLTLEQRFKGMMAAGFLDEMRGLFARGDLSAEHSAMRAVGYRQLWQFLAGEINLEQAVERAVIATRQLAKRQMTWVRQRPQARGFDCNRPEVVDTALDALAVLRF